VAKSFGRLARSAPAILRSREPLAVNHLIDSWVESHPTIQAVDKVQMHWFFFFGSISSIGRTAARRS
jgi:hypothetical protein